MNEITLPADITDAFDHLMLVGLASILEDDAESERVCRLLWCDTRVAALSTSDDLDIASVASVVGQHVRRWAQSTWLESEGDYTAKDGERQSNFHATLSPRLSGIQEPDGWRRLQHDRQAAIDVLQTVGDQRYVGALGEPSYWSGRKGDKSLQSDYGASRWEMVTRNKGQEFVGGRLLPLAQRVAQWSDQRIMDGLTGRTLTDEVSNNPSQSRTGTGLHRPMATDNARAWCALLGVAAFPHTVNTSAQYRDTTAGLTQMSKQRRFAILPVFDRPWTLAKYRSVVRSEALLRFGVALVSAGALRGNASRQGIAPSQGVDWLKEKGVISCVLFNQYMSDNQSAPERWLERGKLYALDAESGS
ncbi:hypothetical protein H6A68_08150 [Bifidobacterium pullorum subsp. saeculare]|uniref:hypothetical protein n=1 Tax=Bifidobacterium pullorum TaxID=78448 RepID=UPI0019592B64|nr:hypothetical protein [Bifidobacterium pullorum]MBM6707007.1 hypothetical protein [Bifidobacterium pullorum subsp. saeculare]